MTCVLEYELEARVLLPDKGILYTGELRVMVSLSSSWLPYSSCKRSIGR